MSSSNRSDFGVPDRALFESMPVGLLCHSAEGKIVSANPAACRILGLTPEQMKGFSFADLDLNFIREDGTKYSPQEIASMFVERKGDPLIGMTMGLVIPRVDRQVWLLVDVVPLHSETKSEVWVTLRDVSADKEMADYFRMTANVFENSQEGIAITDARQRFLYINRAVARISGYSREELIGNTPRIFQSGRHPREFYADLWQSITTYGHWRGEIWNRRKSGEIYPQLLTISAVTTWNGDIRNYFAVFSDITNAKKHQNELERTAHYDDLTGVPNRVLLNDRLRQAQARSERTGTMLAVCWLDLDGFKAVNDKYGHPVGDQILIEVARRAEALVRADDTIARIGGDEFVILQVGLEKAEDCKHSLQRILDAIAHPIDVAGVSHKLSGSIGVAMYPMGNQGPEELLRHADQAMYLAKQAGKNQFKIYDPEQEQRARTQQNIIRQIALDLDHGRFELHYQPSVELRTGKLIGAEALIRWRQSDRKLVPAGEFLRLVENSELEVKLGDWVISAALDQLMQWRKAGLEIALSINISSFHLDSPGFVAKLQRQLDSRVGLRPCKLQFEISEATALSDLQKVTMIMERCRQLSVEFTLDDFGKGRSSIAHLSTLPVTTLKIAQYLVGGMLDDSRDRTLVRGVVALSKAFGHMVVAGGIENERILKAVLDLGCERGQGYGIARPMPAEELLQWSKGRR